MTRIAITSTPANSDDDNALADLFRRLAEVTPAEQPAVVAAFLCQHPHLKQQVEALLGAQEQLEQARGAAPPAALKILGPFHILGRIHGGGMGELYEAREERLNRRVIIKVIRRGEADATARERFENEQQVLARLHHTHIVPIFASGEDSGVQYYAMPYIDGANLRDVLDAAREWQAARSGASEPSLEQLVKKAAEDRRKETGATEAAPQPVLGTTCGAAAELSATAPGGSAQADARPAGGASARPRLSAACLRTMIAALADAAEAVEHIHAAGYVHCDLKPANLMVDPTGHCSVIDLGVAMSVSSSATPGGTPRYMAPEQTRGKIGIGSDVWGLGVTLYEVLTLREAFRAPSRPELEKKIQKEPPTPPSRLVTGVERDLEAICLKALEKEPARRYPTAQAFADDLRRWLRYEPTHVRPAWPARRFFLWARRNKGWAAAIGAAFICLVFIAVAGVLLAAAAGQREQEQKYQSLLQRLQLLRMGRREAGWYEDSKALVREAAKIRPGDSFLRDQAAADLAGFDAHQFKKLYGFGASGVAFSDDGKRLLIGGWEKDEGRILDLADPGAAPVPSGQAGAGPVAFRADGAPLQLVKSPGEGEGLRIWDADMRRPVGSFTIPDQQKYKVEAMALAANGAFVAAAMTPKDGPDEKHKPLVALWDAEKKDPVKTWDVSASALAFTPDGGILAIAGEDAHAITLWSVPKGERLADLPSGHAQIDGLAFGHSPRRPQGKPRSEGKWQLAAGALGGEVAVWDLTDRVVQAHCRGLHTDVSSLAFSPDGALLAAAGRGQSMIWDAATGRPLLYLNDHNSPGGVAVSPDGSRVAVSSEPIFAEPSQSGLDVWELENGRGIRTLLGLSAATWMVSFSPDGKLAACQAQNWQIALWEADSGRLRYVLDSPRGPFMDNCSMTFSADGRRLAFSTGTEAKSWDVATGEEVSSWELAPGLEDALAFNAEGKLLLLRSETKDAKVFPVRENPWREHPRVCRLRELPEGGRARLIEEITDFPRHVFHIRAAPDGSVFVVEGLDKDPKDGGRTTLRGYDGATGKKLWDMDWPDSRERGLEMHRSGRLVALFRAGPTESAIVLDPSTSKTIRTGQDDRASFSPPDKYWWRKAKSGLSLYRGREKRPLITLGFGPNSSLREVVLDGEEGRFLSGDADGSVRICDIEEMRRRLTDLGLGW
jgi:serine/threonine protein kinase/WD40 repeat protein